jgi:MoxR-like ATPase
VNWRPHGYSNLTPVNIVHTRFRLVLDDTQALSIPTLAEPVATFIASYLVSRETVLILQGPPGTGKTRLVRAILAAMSARKADSAQVLYTADMRALETDFR